MIEAAKLSADDLPGHLEVFKRFAAIAVGDVELDEDGDLLLFETAVREGVFFWDVGRQLFADTEPTTIGLEVTFDLDDELQQLPRAEHWGGGAAEAAEFFAEVEQMPAWRSALTRAPRSLEVASDDE
jgi:hypothetical protein